MKIPRSITPKILKNLEKEDILLIIGARQVGKTWLMKEFGKRKYSQIAYVNFESSKLLKSLFEDDFDIERIISAIQIETGIQIKAEGTLIIFPTLRKTMVVGRPAVLCDWQIICPKPSAWR